MTDTAEQPVSLHEELSKVYDASLDAPEVEETEISEPEAEAGEVEEGRQRDESGKFVKGEKKAKKSDETEETEEEPEAIPALEAPQHWSAEDKAVFAKVSREGQEFLLRRHKDMEADYTRKTQEIAETKRFKDYFDQLLSPYRQTFAMSGLDDIGGVRYLLGWFQSLQQNPAETLTHLAQQYGIDFNQKQEDNIDPNVKALRDEIYFLKSQIAQDKQAQHTQVSNSLVQQVRSFSEEKDSNGNLKHPHFEKVRQDMAVLVQSGRATNINEAYELAVRLHPDIHDKQIEQSLQQKLEAAKKKEQDEAAKKAAQAKKAATGIRSGSASVEKQGAKTLRDQLSALYDQQATT